MRRALSALLFLSTAAFVALVAVAMVRYPGGTWIERERVGHAFWQNFFCDLTQPTSLSGGPNPAAPFARAGMIVMAIALLPFWLLLSLAYPERAAYARSTRYLGVLSALAAIAVPLTPSLVWAVLHAAASLFAGALGTMAATAAYAGMWRSRARPMAALVCATIAIVAGFLNGVLDVVHLAGPPLSPVMPIAQKIASIGLIGWMILVGLHGLKRVQV